MIQISQVSVLNSVSVHKAAMSTVNNISACSIPALESSDEVENVA